MKRTVLVLLTLSIVLTLVGCGKKTQEPDAAAERAKDKPVVENTGQTTAASERSAEPAENEASGDQAETRDPPEVVIKTENRVSNQEADAMLDELDSQLSEFLDTLDRLDDVTDEDLQY